MNEAAVHALARHAGVAIEWRDYANKPQHVSTEAVARILTALGLPCGTADELSHSRHILEAAALPPLITATAGEPIDLPIAARNAHDQARVTMEDGAVIELPMLFQHRGARLAGVESPGYHTVEVGDQRATLAVAPARCLTIADFAPHERVWGIAAQTYGLRSAGDCGIGDMAGVTALAQKAAAQKADVLALSPMHALFVADPNHYSPYSPSNRLFYNPLHADARTLFGDVRLARAMSDTGLGERMSALEQLALIDWPESARAKMSMFRRLFEDFSSNDLLASPATILAADFNQFRASGGTMLEAHARFEALHADKLLTDRTAWNWSDWPAQWRNPASMDVRHFAERHKNEITFHCFLQWIADRSFAAAQAGAKRAGMRIGLIADLAVGMSGAGSHAWTSQDKVLVGLEIGAPPDLYNARGQNWGLTTFSPHALRAEGFAPFIATLRASLRHAGGLRIDHAMGLLRLWVVPRGADPNEGAYLAYPIDDLMRLSALESHRHRAILIGEDLGTVPAGFRELLAETGVYGMSVLWFERERNSFTPPQAWPEASAAMTSTHDLPTVAGWWRGKDIDTREQLGLVADAGEERASRIKDRQKLWRAFRRANAAAGDLPSPAETSRATDAAVTFIAHTAADLALLPLEDALALEDQPNIPGTIDEHPNWRRRYPGQAEDLLDGADTRQRLAPLARRSHQ
jgi:4-alpha-glucanotransferase